MITRLRTYYLKTFGCRVNQAEGLKIEKDLQKIGFFPLTSNQVPDLIVINSCVVTAKAEKEIKQVCRSLKRRYPSSFLVVIGCGPAFWKLKKEDFSIADLLLDNQEKKKLAAIIKKKFSCSSCYYDTVHGSRKRRTFLSNFGLVRALVKIQDGCNQSCSYCLVPYLRTKIKSKPIPLVVKEIKEWVDKGVKEIVLTGVNLSLYRQEIPEFLEQILKKTKISRIRFGSISVEVMSDRLIELYRREYQKSGIKTRLCRHFHIPLQSGSKKILEKMARKYTPDQFRQLVKKIKKEIPGVTISTDLIVGFPGETEKDFKDSLQLVKELKFIKVHLFRFSKREKTFACRMIEGKKWKPVPLKTVKRRAREAVKLNRAVGQKEVKRLKGEPLSVLFEGKKAPGVYRGYSDNYLDFRKKSSQNLVGQIKRVKLRPEK